MVKQEQWKVQDQTLKAWSVLGGLLLTLNFGLSTAFSQQPQAQSGQPLYPVNAKYVQGFGPGYWPTAGSGLTLNLAAGTAVCSNVVQNYAGGTLTLASNAANYVYLDATHSCTPASNTTGFSSTTIPLAEVATNGSSITAVTDVRTMFVAPSSVGTLTSVAMTGDGVIYNTAVSGSPITSSGTLAPQLLPQSPHFLLAGPGSGAAAAPTFRALVSADLPTIAISGGGTGQTTASAAFNALSPLTTEGDLLYYHSSADARLGTGGNGQCLTSNGTDPVWGSCSGTSSLAWSTLINPTANLALSMSTYTTAFNHTSPVNWTWANTTASTSSTAQSSPLLNLSGTYWNGSASATDSWSFQNVVASGTNGNSTLTLAHTGSTGTASFSVPNLTNTSTTQYGVMYGGGSSTAEKSTAAGASGLPLLGQGTAAPAFGTLGIVGGGTGQTTANAGFNALSPLTTEGDLLYYHSSSNTRLAKGTSGQCLTSNGTDPVWDSCSTGTGTVTSVGLAMPSMFSITGSPVTGSGTLTAALTSETANQVFASPNGSSGTPGFRALVGADLPAPTASAMGGVMSVTCTSGQFVSQISTAGLPGCQTPSGSGGSDGLGNGSTVIDATTLTGADFGVQVGSALAHLYALGGGTVDARGFECPTQCQIGTANLIIGDGVHPVTVLLPSGTISRNTLSSTALAAQILYNSYVTIGGQGVQNTIISGASSTDAVQQVYNANGVQNVYLHDFSIQDTGSVTSGSVALDVGGTNPTMPIQAPNAVTYSTNTLNGSGNFFPGREAQVAIYNKALTATQILNHYTVGSSGSGYETTITGDGPIAYWPLKETSGTTATDLIAARNGTYVGGVTLGSVAGISGDVGTTAPVFDGSTGYVSLPSYTWFSGGSYTVEGWVYPTSAPGPSKKVFSFSDSTASNFVYAVDDASQYGTFLAVGVAGVEQSVSQTNVNFGENAWMYFAWVFQNGGATLYLNGTLITPGTDVLSGNFENIYTGGADIGVQLNSTHGCICYNHFHNVWPSGASFGARTLNNSGYAFGVNQNQWYGGRFQGPVGLYDAGGDKNTYNSPDFESNGTSGMELLGYNTLVVAPYEEASGADYFCGDFNMVSGPMVFGGAPYSPTYCSGSNNGYGGPLSNFTWGPGAVPPTIGVGSGIVFGGHNLYDDGASNVATLFKDGPTFSGSQVSIHGYSGHSNWNMGLAQPHSGTSSTGRVTVNQLPNPAAPTITASGGTGTNYTYGLVCNDQNGGSTLPGTFSSAVSGPATLGGLLTAAISSGGSGYLVNDSVTVSGGGSGTATATVTSIGTGGVVTGLSVTSGGSEYVTKLPPGWGWSTWSTTGGTGSGLTINSVASTSTYMSIVPPVEDGCYTWTLLKGSSSSQVPNTGGNVGPNHIDFGLPTTTYSPLGRNTTADAVFNGSMSTANNILDDGSGNASFAGHINTASLPWHFAGLLQTWCYGTLVATSGTYYFGGFGGVQSACGSLTNTLSGGMPIGGASTASDITLKNFRCKSSAPGHSAASGGMQVYDNGTNKIFSCVIGTGTSCADNSTSFSPAGLGDPIQFSVGSIGSGETLANISCSLEEWVISN
jgi:hypothetical protein